MAGRRVASLILAGMALSACSSGQPTSPGLTASISSASGPSPTASFDTATVGQVTLYICGTCEEAADRLGLDLHSDVVDVTRHIDAQLSLPTAYVDIADNPKGAIPGVGVGGVSLGTRVSIFLDPQFPNFRQTVFLWLPRTLAHELDETKRRDALAEGSRLRDHLVTDGIADTFSVQTFPQGPPNPWDEALTPEQERQAWTMARPHLDDVLDDHGFAHWFFGGGAIPHWAGYTIGFHVIASYLALHPGITAVDLTTMDARKILAGSGYRP
ncbi:MAG: DUF2268 domain-containing protein [Actinomycetota bacterium]|nr:DUF2268 domain-containing protein [Actinomycetota bacterium]